MDNKKMELYNKMDKNKGDKILKELGYERGYNKLELVYSYIDKTGYEHDKNILFLLNPKEVVAYYPDMREEEYEADSASLTLKEIEAVKYILEELHNG